MGELMIRGCLLFQSSLTPAVLRKSHLGGLFSLRKIPIRIRLIFPRCLSGFSDLDSTGKSRKIQEDARLGAKISGSSTAAAARETPSCPSPEFPQIPTTLNSESPQNSIKNANGETPTLAKRLGMGQYDDANSGNLKMPKNVDGKIFLPFYHFPFIVAFRTFVRLKLYQTVVTFFMVPIILVAKANGLVSSDTAIAAAIGVNLFALVSLFAMSRLFQRWIGRMYLEENKEHVLVSHLSFTGRRRDVVMRTADVVPLDDLGETAEDAFIKFKKFNDPQFTLYYNLTAGGILDEEAFKLVFGTVPVIRNSKVAADGAGKVIKAILKKRITG